MKKIFLCLILAFGLLTLPRVVFAEPFLNQWEWDQPKMYGKVKMVMKEEAVYNIKLIFNDQQQKIEEQLLNKGRIIYKTIFQYDERGNLTAILRYSAQGNLLAKNTAVYEGGFLKTLQSSDEPANGKFLYDEKGLLDEIVVYKSDGTRVGKHVFRFNQYRNLIEKKILDASLRLRERKVYFYNDKGFPVGELTYNSKGDLVRKDIYDYQYDNQGNWIVKTMQSEVFIGSQKGKIPPVVEKRKFTYFNI